MEPPLLPLLFVLVAGSAAQLAVGPVSLADGGHVISYDEGPSPDNSLIRCPYDLQEGQQVIAVIWELLKEDKRAGSYKWRPGRGGTTTGVLRGKVNQRREDSDLELTSVEHDLAGLYSCTVKTGDGGRGNAQAEILVEEHQLDASASAAAADYSLAGFAVGPIAVGDHGYISYEEGPSPANSVVRCPFRLEEGQEVATVVWRVQKKGRRLGSFKWKPSGPKTAFGLLRGKVSLTRPDSDLELTSLKYNMAGNYSCVVSLTDGTKGTAEDEVLIVDTSGNEQSLSVREDEQTCALAVTESTYVYPEPQIRSGMFSEQVGGFYQTFNNWEVLKHKNGSATYSYHDHMIYVDSNTPTDATYRSEVSVMKSNGDLVPVTTASRIYVPRFERSCRDLELAANQAVAYNSYQRTCFGGIRRPDAEPLKAEVTCADGYVPRDHIPSVTMTCQHRGGNDYEWFHGEEGYVPQHLICVVPPSTTEPSTTTTTTTTATESFRPHSQPGYEYGYEYSAATCLEVEPPSITDGHRYISYSVRPSGNQSTIVCNYTLGEGQAVSGVLWEILKEEVSAGTFEWKPNAPATATGLLKDKVNLERDDSDLELTTLTYELSANYSCTVTADDGRTASERNEILIIDTTSNHVYHGSHANEAKCRLEVDIKYYPVFPQPTVGAGLYSDSLGGFYEEIANWARVVHANGSVGFSCLYEFQVNENTPADAYFTSSLGVTKSDGTYIGLSSMTSNFYFKRGCKNVSISENQTVSYNTDVWTCFGEPFSHFGVQARVECAGGFVSGGNVTSVTLVCDSVNATTHRWIPGDEGLLPEDLVCDPYTPEPTPADGATMRVASCYALLTATLLLCFLSR